MMEFQERRERARAMIETQKLPATTKPRDVEGGNEVKGHRCILCGELIKGGEFKYTVRAPILTDTPTPFVFHFLCHAAWQLEADAFERAQSPT